MNKRNRRIGWIFAALLAALVLACAPTGRTARAQDDPEAKKNAQQARSALDAMVRALGGPLWLNMRNSRVEGRLAAFYQGKPTGGTADYWAFHQWPDKDRVELTKHRDVVQIYSGRQGWEITYKGKEQLPQDIVDDYLRRRDHSIETAVKVWLNDPRTILIYEGQKLAERHLADQVTLISASNEAVTIQMDAQTHLPLSRSFEWRDPLYKDKNEDKEEYDDYHVVDGFPTAFTITRLKNGDMTQQRFVFKAGYNETLPPEAFDVDATTARIKKK